MKTTSRFLAAFAVTALLRAADAPLPPCCASDVATAPKPPCCASCADEKPATVAANLSARSIYQLDAKWTNDAGQSVQLASLRGQPVIVAMFFAQCEYACPMLVADIRRARELLPADVRAKAKVVLVSFDTARDTPAALKAYRERNELGAEWVLLRGDAPVVQELAMLLGVKFKQDARGQFAHSNLVTVLSAEGEVVHQRAGLQRDMSEVARAVVLAAK
jgi:protein SCO1/2